MTLRKATALWILGLLTGVPYAAWFLFYRAQREQYALLITFVLFWIFGYWGIAGPLPSMIKCRRRPATGRHRQQSSSLRPAISAS